MDSMIVDWKLWSNKREENDIMMQFADKARMYTLIYTCRTCLYLIPLKYSTFSIFFFVSSVHIHCRYIIYSCNVCTTRNGCNRPFKRKSYHGLSCYKRILYWQRQIFLSHFYSHVFYYITFDNGHSSRRHSTHGLFLSR